MTNLKSKFFVLVGAIAVCLLCCVPVIAYGESDTGNSMINMASTLYHYPFCLNHYVYGTVDGEYAILMSESQNKDTAVDIVKSDGTHCFHASQLAQKDTETAFWGD